MRREDFVEDAPIVDVAAPPPPLCPGAGVRHVGGGTRVQERLGRGGRVRHVAVVAAVLRARGKTFALKWGTMIITLLCLGQTSSQASL